jgi:hypothetical protein
VISGSICCKIPCSAINAIVSTQLSALLVKIFENSCVIRSCDKFVRASLFLMNEIIAFLVESAN